MTPTPMLVAILGSAAMVVVMAGLWFPAYVRSRSLRRRLTGALADGSLAIASDVAGARRRRGALRRIRRDGGNRWLAALEDRIERAALDRLGVRFKSDDMSLIVASINVHAQIGGSLAHILDDISATLRERVRIEGDIRALTAQQRYSAYVLALLPVAVAAALFLISRDYIQLQIGRASC